MKACSAGPLRQGLKDRECRPYPFYVLAALLALTHLGIAAESLAPLTGREPYLNPALPVEQRVGDLVSHLTLEEKAMLLDHRGPTLERFHLRADQWNQCLNGVKWDRPTTLFPTCIAMGATWNPPLVEEIASALSDEARAIYNAWHQDPDFKGEKKGLIYRAPVINISRNPYWGRIHEVYSEDPYLTGRYGVAYVRGLQGNDPHYLKIAATLKHFAVNNVETNRTKLDAKVPERWLHEYWLPHFHDAVVEGKAQSLMASYNAINGTPNNINHWLLTDVLKTAWGHDGFVVSDLGGVRTMVTGHAADKMSYVDAVARSLMAGCDFSDKEYAENIPSAVREGKLTEQRLNDAVTRVLRVRMRLGEFDPQELQPWSKIPLDVIDGPAHRALALKASQQSIVLLQNKGGLLPLDQTKLKRIAVIGPHADRITLNNYNAKYRNGITALRGLKDRLPADCEVTYCPGGEIGGKTNHRDKNAPTQEIDSAAELQKALTQAKAADVAIVFVGTNGTIEQEGRDRSNMGLPGNQEELVKAVLDANPRTVVVLMSAGPLTVSWLKEHVPAMLQAWWPGEEGGHAIADVLLGNINPAGRLPYTVYASEEQVPPRDEYDISMGFTYMYLKGKPLYAFGHGLSYTTFAYSNARALSQQIPANDTLRVSVDVKNTGDREGDEVVQLYIHDAQCSVKRAIKELRGFARIPLRPGETKPVTWEIPGRKLAYYSEKSHAFAVEAGKFDILIGSSSEDIKCKEQVEVTSAGIWQE